MQLYGTVNKQTGAKRLLTKEEFSTTLYYLIYYFIYTDNGYVEILQGTKGERNKKVMKPLKTVKYGKYQPTPVQVLEASIRYAAICNGMNVFDFGAGDGYAARYFACYGADVEGLEQDKEVYRYSIIKKSHIDDAITMLFNTYSTDISKQGIYDIVDMVESRVLLRCGDCFDGSIDYGQYDMVYMYYPEPQNDIMYNGSIFNHSLSEILTEGPKAMKRGAQFLIARQGVRSPLEIINLRQVNPSLSVKTGTISPGNYTKNGTINNLPVIEEISLCLYEPYSEKTGKRYTDSSCPTA